jgi:CubicO group peptidase (beta-lactamase class C family)
MPTGVTASMQERLAELRERVAAGIRRHNVPGVAVGLLYGGAEVYVCEGITSVSNPLAVDEATFFQIGSITKTYTATAIMVLVERGLVSLDVPVRRYLPGFRLKDEAVAAQVSVAQLLNHTAGWAGDVFVDTGYGDDALARYVECLANTPQETPLGTFVSYNNVAVNVAGRLIEVMTGMTYEVALQELVLDPLGLSEHLFYPWDVMLRRFAVGHQIKEGMLQVAPWHAARNWRPAGAEFAATVRDQLRYARFHLADPVTGAGDGSAPVLQRETLAQMQIPTTPTSGDSSDAGVGIIWNVRQIDGVRIVSHGGNTFGHESLLALVPERAFALSILTNAYHGHEFVNELSAWVLQACLGLVERDPEPLALTPPQAAAYTGTYASPQARLEVTNVEGRLVGTITAIPAELAALPPIRPFSIEIVPGNQYLITDGLYKGTRYPVWRDADGRIVAMSFGGRAMPRRD